MVASNYMESSLTEYKIRYIQYWSVDGKYRIYLTRLRNGVKDELLASLSPRFAPSQINSIVTVNRPILYLSCNPRCPKKIILTRKNAFFNARESSLFGVMKYQIFFADKNSRTNSSQKEVK